MSEPEARQADDELPDARGPIVVLSYACGGAALLNQVLGASRSLACTAGTGLVPLCHAGLATWQRAENRASPSALAVKSVRSLAATMITAMVTASGALRWCETASVPADVLRSFRTVFPSATLICLHRQLPGVLQAGLQTYPWGLGDSPFWQYSALHPGNSAATIAAYWVACEQTLLELEEQYPQSCVRVKHEDLKADVARVAGGIYARLRLDSQDLAILRQPTSQPAVDGKTLSSIELPADSIPPPLLEAVNRLHARLGYAAVTLDGR